MNDSASISKTEVTFDSAGTWNGTSTYYELERDVNEIAKDMGGYQTLSNTFDVMVPAPETEAVSGTYTVNSDGTGAITHGEGTESIFVSADGSVILMGSRNYDSADHHAWLSMGIGVKKGSGLSAASLSGSYVFHEIQSEFSGPDANGGWGTCDEASFGKTEVTFDGAGAWRGRYTAYELQRSINEIARDMGGYQALSNTFDVMVPAPWTHSISGTYSINRDGTGTITHSEGTEPIFVSADGSLILLGKRENKSAELYAWLFMGVGVKKTRAATGEPWMLLLVDD
jgi:hypothetical protein